jgi:hypothetical protein
MDFTPTFSPATVETDGLDSTAQPFGLEGQLGVHAPAKPRQAERKHVALGAALRQRGAGGVTIRVQDLSTHGFRAETHLELLPGTDIWLRLPGLEAWHGRVAWAEGNQIGCAFERPLHPAVLDNLLRRAV